MAAIALSVYLLLGIVFVYARLRYKHGNLDAALDSPAARRTLDEWADDGESPACLVALALTICILIWPFLAVNLLLKS